MKLIIYIYNDDVNKSVTTASMHAVNQEVHQITKIFLIAKYPKVFDGGVELLDGEYLIKLDGTIDPAQTCTETSASSTAHTDQGRASKLKKSLNI